MLGIFLLSLIQFFGIAVMVQTPPSLSGDWVLIGEVDETFIGGAGPPSELPRLDTPYTTWGIVTGNGMQMNWARNCGCWTSYGVNMNFALFVVMTASGEIKKYVPHQAFDVCFDLSRYERLPADAIVIHEHTDTCYYNSWNHDISYCAEKFEIHFPEPVFLLYVTDTEEDAQICQSDNLIVYNLNAFVLAGEETIVFPDTHGVYGECYFDGMYMFCEFRNVPIPSDEIFAQGSVLMFLDHSLSPYDSDPIPETLFNSGPYDTATQSFPNTRYSVTEANTELNQMTVSLVVSLQELDNEEAVEKTELARGNSEGENCSYVRYGYALYLQGATESVARPVKWWDLGDGTYTLEGYFEVSLGCSVSQFLISFELDSYWKDDVRPFVAMTYIYSIDEGFNLEHDHNVEDCNDFTGTPHEWSNVITVITELWDIMMAVRTVFFLPVEDHAELFTDGLFEGSIEQTICAKQDGTIIETIPFVGGYYFGFGESPNDEYSSLPFSISVYSPSGNDNVFISDENVFVCISPSADTGFSIDPDSVEITITLKGHDDPFVKALSRENNEFFESETNEPGAVCFEVVNSWENLNDFFHTISFDVKYEVTRSGRRSDEETMIVYSHEEITTSVDDDDGDGDGDGDDDDSGGNIENGKGKLVLDLLVLFVSIILFSNFVIF